MEIFPVFYQGINCLDILSISYAKYLKHEIEIIFSNAWNFRFELDDENFGDCFGVEETRLTSSQYEQLGLNIEFFPIHEFESFITYLKQMFKKEIPVGISIDSFYCPWHVRFKIDHGRHYILGFDINDQNEIICLDPGFNNQSFEKLPIHLLEKGYEWYFILENRGSTNSYDYLKIYIESIERLRNFNIPTKIKQFSQYFNENFDYATECKDILYNPWACQVFHTFMSVVGGRRQFMQYLQYMHGKITINNYEEILKSFQHICSKWDTIRWLLVKSKPETFNGKYRDKISNMLLQIAEDEAVLIKMLTNPLSSENLNTPKENCLKQAVESQNSYPVGLVDILNNKAFGTQDGHYADLTGLSEWCVYDTALKNAISLLNPDFKLYINEKTEFDNVTCLGQQIRISSNPYTELIILATADFEDFMTTIKILTIDGQEFDLEFDCSCWTNPKTDITKKQKLSFSRAHKNPDGSLGLYEDKGHIYECRIPIPTKDALTKVILPLCPNIHIFAINLAI